MVVTDVVVFILILAALFVSALFLWGIWHALRSMFGKPRRFDAKQNPFTLARNPNNPLISPGKYEFDQVAVMNPAAIDDGERTHLFYRAVGSDGVSRIGYANSRDGMTIDEQLPYAVFALEGPDPHLAALRRSYAEKNYPGLVASGGSWAGTEDPRAVVIDDRAYLSFSAFHSWDSVRIGVVSIALSDLKQKLWKWSRPAFLSPHNQVHKNWVFFPEKVSGMFAVLHSISPKVEIEYRTDLSAVGAREPFIESATRHRADIDNDNPRFWHDRMRGAGTPPLKTPFGWLLFYHAMETGRHHEYKVGALLLDKNNPSRVIARAPAPVLAPDAHYETNGIKPGIVYATGATARGDVLTVYYGASDNFVCAATTSLSGFVRKLLNNEQAMLSPVLA